MPLSQTARKGLMTAAALGALALGGSAIANAASSGSGSSTQRSSAAAQPGYGTPGSGQAPAQRPDPTRPGGHVGSNGKTEEALSADVAAKVKAAAEAKVPGGTVLRVETDVDHGSPYEAHVRKGDGTEVEVLVDADFKVTAVNAMRHP
jgi:hypothetical protein